jgi:hypothetical protein
MSLATIPQQIIGDLISREKYTFVYGNIIAAIVVDAIAEYEKLTGKSAKERTDKSKRSLREKLALQGLTDAIHNTYESEHIKNVSLEYGDACIIQRLISKES